MRYSGNRSDTNKRVDLVRKQQVVGSTPTTGSTEYRIRTPLPFLGSGVRCWIGLLIGLFRSK
jgi:hypothetical protein